MGTASLENYWIIILARKVGELEENLCSTYLQLLQFLFLLVYSVHLDPISPHHLLRRFLGQQQEILKLKLKDKIHFLGTKPQTEVPTYMQQADIFILPSVYDGWGAVVNEALQAGCYVICSDAAGASDLILQDDSGIPFRCPDS